MEWTVSFDKYCGAALVSTRGYGIGRQFQLLADGRVTADLQVFTDHDRAAEWLCAANVG